MVFIPGAPFPIETSFVIVDHGDEVKHAVMSPQPQIVTSVERRVGRLVLEGARHEPTINVVARGGRADKDWWAPLRTGRPGPNGARPSKRVKEEMKRAFDC